LYYIVSNSTLTSAQQIIIDVLQQLLLLLIIDVTIAANHAIEAVLYQEFSLAQQLLVKLRRQLLIIVGH